MRETTDRMADDRREREKHRAQMREIQTRTTIPRSIPAAAAAFAAGTIMAAPPGALTTGPDRNTPSPDPRYARA
jgi:hypothetical protein